MTARSEWYRLNAEKCLALAQRCNDPESQRSLLAMANAWLALAEQVRTEKGDCHDYRIAIGSDDFVSTGRTRGLLVNLWSLWPRRGSRSETP